MKPFNKLLITAILLYLAWRWLNQPSETRPAPCPEKHQEPDLPVERKAQVFVPKRQDDLTAIKGIGLKAAQALGQAGIRTFDQLASLETDQIKTILKAAGISNLDPTTWPEQATIAAKP